jgi:predicted CoA-binding protein
MKRHIQMGHLLLRAEDLNRYDKVTVVSASCDAQHPSFDVKRFVLGGVECS